MTQTSTIQDIFKQRYHAFFLDVRAAQANSQKTDEPILKGIDLAQSKTTRSLLRVEKQAIREKNLNQKHALNYLNENLNQINIKVEERLIEELKDTENLYRKVVGIEDTIPQLLDLLNVKAATTSRIEALALELPWFYQDLLKLVNQPKYRRTDSKGKVIHVDSLRAALNRFGIENLNPVVLSLAFRRWLPQITDPYPQIKNRLWEEALATSIISRKLAAIHQVNENHAFSLGMLSLLGNIVVVRLYFRLFETVQREALVESQFKQEHELHDALSRLVPAGEFLTQLIDKYALPVTAALISMMDMKRVFIANAMQEVVSDGAQNEISPLALVLNQAKGYSRYRLLKMYNLVDLQESKDFVRTLQLPKGALTILKTTDIRTLNLQITNTET
ncbi:HDOD domain-containing protein [Paraglaciecola sp.]|uniref:HDOD domain-containing protein n=1 Tax=Paraglaciecola sp. TaxID=1920173 RepID=UPI0030F4353B